MKIKGDLAEQILNSLDGITDGIIDLPKQLVDNPDVVIDLMEVGMGAEEVYYETIEEDVIKEVYEKKLSEINLKTIEELTPEEQKEIEFLENQLQLEKNRLDAEMISQTEELLERKDTLAKDQYDAELNLIAKRHSESIMDVTLKYENEKKYREKIAEINAENKRAKMKSELTEQYRAQTGAVIIGDVEIPHLVVNLFEEFTPKIAGKIVGATVEEKLKKCISESLSKTLGDGIGDFIAEPLTSMIVEYTKAENAMLSPEEKIAKAIAAGVDSIKGNMISNAFEEAFKNVVNMFKKDEEHKEKEQKNMDERVEHEHYVNALFEERDQISKQWNAEKQNLENEYHNRYIQIETQYRNDIDEIRANYPEGGPEAQRLMDEARIRRETGQENALNDYKSKLEQVNTFYAGKLKEIDAKIKDCYMFKDMGMGL